MAGDFHEIWRFSEAKAVRPVDNFFLMVLVAGGIFSIFYLAEWWFRGEHIGSLALFVVLSSFFWYAVARNLLIWINYLRIRKPIVVPEPESGMRVAVFTTSAPGEPLSMFDKTFAALAALEYPHTTYLLDSTGDPAFREMAEKHGAVWLELSGLPGAKAGKVNRALELTDEEYILILDPDHIAFPNFLDQTLGFFSDPKVGFVQVSQGYYNQYRSFTAAAAAEQTYTFYGPTQMGMYGYGTAVAIGANCTFRRKALESIGGHAVGLAEDLLTSIRLHAASWKSVYNPVIVSRGLVPEDFGSFCQQQLKWARGVFEVLFVELPSVFSRLSFWQKLAYSAIGTYYLTGVITLFFILVPFLYFLTGVMPARMNFSEFIVTGSLFVIMATMIYLYVQRFLSHPHSERGIHWRGMILKFACWPVYTLGFVLGVLNYKIPYIPTAKKAVTGAVSPFARPLLLYCGAFLVSLIAVLVDRRYFVPESELLFTSEKTWGMIGFALIACIMSFGGLMAARESLRLQPDEPWRHVDLEKINWTKTTNR